MGKNPSPQVIAREESSSSTSIPHRWRVNAALLGGLSVLRFGIEFGEGWHRQKTRARDEPRLNLMKLR